MYESFFGFCERPFGTVPRTERYYPSESIERARQTLTRCIERAEGCGLITGPTGSGKTLLLQILCEQFQDCLAPVLLANAQLSTRKDLLQCMLFEMGLPYRDMQEGELRLSLIDQLTPGKSQREGILLLVDEAHALSPKLLEELRLLTNLVRGGIPRVRLVLAGGQVLEERFASPKLSALNQRLAARCYLEPLTSAETYAYVRAQTAAAGGDADQVWSDEGLRTVNQVTDGCPRLINQLCDHALLLAATAGICQVDRRVAEEAWADLQQLPMPHVGGQPTVGPSGEAVADPSTVIEFGSLDEADEAGFAAIADQAGQPDEADLPVEEAAAVPAEEETEAAADAPRPVDGPFEPQPHDELQMDEIQEHLTNIEQTLKGELASEPQVELQFDDLPADEQGAHELDATEDDDPSSELDCPSPSEDDEIVIRRYAGLEADTVVPLAPAARPLSDYQQDDGTNLSTDDAEPRATPTWRESLDAIEATPEQETVDEPAELEQPPEPAAEAAHATAEVQAAATLRDESTVKPNDLDVVQHRQIVGLSPMALDVGELEPTSAVIETGATSSHAGADDTAAAEATQRTIIVDAQHTAAPATPAADRSAFPAGEQVYSNSRSEDAAPSPANSEDDTDATAYPAGIVSEHPTIPVRQRDYRQLFAKLRQREIM